MMEEESMCKVCNKRPPHGYIQGSGAFLKDTCLPCFRRPGNSQNHVEGGDTKRSNRTHATAGKEDT